MRRNTYKNQTPPPAPPQDLPPQMNAQQRYERRKGVWEGILDFEFANDSQFAIRLLPYLIFLSVLGLIYIANRHYTERVVREVTNLRNEVEELRVNYTILKSEYINASRQSEIAKKVASQGIEESNEPNYTISAKEK